MFNLGNELRQWRRETEATLAFDPEELDELEDHLKFAVEKAVREGTAPEAAWSRAVSHLGASPLLALEFSKSKLLPALVRLVRSWLQPGLLLTVFCLKFFSTYAMNWPSIEEDRGVPNLPFWIVSWVSFALLLALLPTRSSRSALLAGTGAALCLIPLLNLAFYHSLGNSIVGPDWSGQGAAFGAWPIGLGLAGLIMLGIWSWKRASLPAVAAIILVLAIAPFCGELIGNLSVRDLFSMPTAHDITLTGPAKSQFMKWKFVDVLIHCVVTIATWLPLALLLVTSLGTILVQWALRFTPLKADDARIFPAPRDLPWIMTLGASGVCWIIASVVEPPVNGNLIVTENSVAHATGSHFGFAFLTLTSAFVFLACARELTRRLKQAECLRLFFAVMLVVGELAGILGIIILPAWAATIDSRPLAHSAVPSWLGWILIAAVVLVAFRQAGLIRAKIHSGQCKPSLWKFDGGSLVQFGALLGLISACCGLVLMMVAIVLAFESTMMISALISWGNSIEHPLTEHFDPSNVFNSTTQAHYPLSHLDFWVYSGLTYISFCLTIGFAVVIVLSGLEFIRFNGYRYYKARRAFRDFRASVEGSAPIVTAE